MLIDENDFQRILPVSKSLSFEQMKPSLKRAQKKYIQPLLGVDLESVLEVAYEDEDATAAEEALLDYVQVALAHLGMWLYMPQGNVYVTENGVMASHTDRLKPAFEWQVKAYRNSLLETGFDGLDELIEHLESVADADFPDWLTSEGCTRSRAYFINTATHYTQYVGALRDSRYRYLQLRGTMERVEYNLVRTHLLGDALYEALKAEILADTVSVANAKLLRGLEGAVAHLTWSQSLQELSLKVDDDGVSVANNILGRTVDSRQPASDGLVQQQMAHHARVSASYQEQVTNLLYAAPDDYPLWRDSGLYVDPQGSTYVENTDESGLYVML